MGPISGQTWFQLLSEEDLAFVRRFVLASGSLKEMARVYGVSYPTVRLRLDRLIAKIKVADNENVGSHFERVLRGMYAEGRIDMSTLKTLLNAHQQEAEESHETERDAD